VDRTGLSLWALIGLGRSWSRIGLDWRLGSAMNLQVLLSWRVRFVPLFLFFFGKFKYANSMMMRFADYQREEWKTEQEQKIHRTLRKKT
jgi:hypothetical protein